MPVCLLYLACLFFPLFLMGSPIVGGFWGDSCHLVCVFLLVVVVLVLYLVVLLSFLSLLLVCFVCSFFPGSLFVLVYWRPQMEEARLLFLASPLPCPCPLPLLLLRLSVLLLFFSGVAASCWCFSSARVAVCFVSVL